ncbi:hypothetical protein ACI2LF_11720 [Kribbella sp. NPDC020789]
MKPLSARSPVFVDSSGHRHRRIRRLGAVVAIPVVGYVVLLVSSLLGGPRVDTPLIPLPEAGRQHPAPRVTPSSAPTTTPSKPTATEKATAGPATVRPVGATTSVPASARPTAPASSAPTTTPATSAPTVTPTVAPTITPGPPTTTPRHGKPSAPPGRTKTPSKP